MREYLVGALLAFFCLLSGCANVPDVEFLTPYGAANYRLDAGDRVRVIVFGQDGLSTNYTVDASGKLSIPLVGSIRARGNSTAGVERGIARILRDKDLVKNPEVSVEVVTYRPYYVLGEVSQSGQYPYTPGMTVQEAVATAGGYTIYADQGPVYVTRSFNGHKEVGLLSPLDPVAPGDTIQVQERLF